MTATADAAEWNVWLDAHAEWRRAAADLIRGRTTALRDAPRPPDGEVPPDEVGLALRLAAASEELNELRNRAARRISGELRATVAYRSAGR